MAPASHARSHLGPFRLARRHPPVSLDDLALMLEIDLALGQRRDFERRLRRALEEARRQGLGCGGKRMVPGDGVEPPTRGFSVRCSTS